MDPPRPPQRLLDEIERARQSALGRYRGSLSRRMPTSPAWRGMPSYRPPSPVPDQVRRAYERAWFDVPDPDEDAYAAGVAWGSTAAYGNLGATTGAYPAAPPQGVAVPPQGAAAPPPWGSTAAYGDFGASPPWGSTAAPPPGATAPPVEEEEDDDDFHWSDDEEKGGGLQIQEAMEASFRSARDDRVQRVKTAYQLKAKEASELDWALNDSISMDRALRRQRARENRAATNGAGSSRRDP